MNSILGGEFFAISLFFVILHFVRMTAQSATIFRATLWWLVYMPSLVCMHECGYWYKVDKRFSGYRIVVVYMHGVHAAAVRFCLARQKLHIK